MRFSYSQFMQDSFPNRVSCLLKLDGIRFKTDASRNMSELTERALDRLDLEPESTFPEIKAWRRAYSQMGIKPTQFRCASEALLRRLRKDRALPKLHPLIDLCNAASAAYAIPIAVFDLDQISGDLTVRQATGDETYFAFSGDIETPDPGEIIFADDAGYAHARRWVNRQSRTSAVSVKTTNALVIAEALHENGPEDIQRLADELATATLDTFGISSRPKLLLSPEAEFVSDPEHCDRHVD